MLEVHPVENTCEGPRKPSWIEISEELFPCVPDGSANAVARSALPEK